MTQGFQLKKRFPHKTNILLVNITRLGDMLQATPTIAGMKMENPDCKITVLVEKQFAEVCHNIPYIDEVMSLDLGMTVRALAREQDGIIDAYEYISECVNDLRSRNFDYCLNMSSSAYTALLLKLIDIKQNGGWTADDEGYRIIESDWARLFASSVFHQNRQYNSLNLVDVFRCSADIDKHPNKLQINIAEDARKFAQDMLANHPFTNTGPLICIQAGASQTKRQWNPTKFIELCNILLREQNARIVLIGTKKELPIIEAISNGCNSENILIAAGKTNIPQLTAILGEADILITGDTGPMHISVAAGTPVISMFLASAFGFETGPYSEGNIIMQPVIGCGPCNPNKACARPDCHDHIDPKMVAQLTAMRIKEDFKSLPEGFADPHRVIIYRSYFDEFGFCNLQSLNPSPSHTLDRYRAAYRKLWLDEIGGYPQQHSPSAAKNMLAVANPGLEGLDQILSLAEEGTKLIQQLSGLIRDIKAPPSSLAQVSAALTDTDRKIEQVGFHHPPLGPLTRMFIFAKENISGSEALGLASQMGEIYENLARRSKKLSQYFA